MVHLRQAMLPAISFNLTYNATKNFQLRYGISQTGNIGPLTWAAINASASGRINTIDARTIAFSKSEGKAIDISKVDRKVRLIENGVVTMTLDARFGVPSSPSHNGSFKIYLKGANYVSKEFNASMPYTMMYYDGEAIHYSDSFAKNDYNGGSNGCTNTRDYEATKLLFGKVSINTRIVGARLSIVTISRRRSPGQGAGAFYNTA